MPVSRILTGNECSRSLPELKMLMLYDPGVGNFTPGVIDHSIALIVVTFRHVLLLKIQGTIFQIAKGIVEILINHSGIKHFIIGDGICSVCKGCLLFLHKGTISGIEANLGSVQHLLNHSGITACWNSLIAVGKVIIIISKAQRKPFNNKGRKLTALSSPLLLGITLHQLLIDIPAGKLQCLLFQILRFINSQLCDLFFDFRLCFGRCLNPPELTERIHIKWKIIDLILINCHRRIYKMIKLRKLLHIIPDLSIRGMENMCPIFMHLNSTHFACINITCQMIPLVNHKARFPLLSHLVRKDRAKQPGPYDQIIVMLIH